MADVPYFIDVYRGIISGLPEFGAVGLTHDDIVKRFAPQIKDRRPEQFPAIALIYDFNNRERWAAIDNVELTIQIEMKVFDDVQTLSEAIRNKLHLFTYADACLTVYKSWHNGGAGQPMYNESHNTYESLLNFEITLGGT